MYYYNVLKKKVSSPKWCSYVSLGTAYSYHVLGEPSEENWVGLQKTDHSSH